ncbi:MAG TPA: hypothetical protein VNJ04_19520 [Gemmatimonadaceae bacterium]|nr:hypothetical protein [Gemmatimonadaceae bacterium]
MVLIPPHAGQRQLRTVTAQNPIFSEPATIPGLAVANLDAVPSDPDAWIAWRLRVRAYRELVRRDCLTNEGQRAAQKMLCAQDPAYFLCMFGVVLEPRDVGDSAPAWSPFILFPVQVQVIRWIQATMARNDMGRGDGVMEKSREMGATWIFCGYMVHQWLYAPIFIAGLISRNEEAVDKKGMTDTLFAKCRAQLGIEPGIPANIRLPVWMLPKGFDKDEHAMQRRIIHPTKTCVLQGETTTELAGVSGRSTMRFNDEAARFDAFDAAWGNQQATSFHRFAISSADRRGDMAFYKLARQAEQAQADPDLPGPSFARLDWWMHPFHTEEWMRNEKARARDPHVFAREYEIDYFSGDGDMVYPRFTDVRAGDFPYDPALHGISCAIDPGVSDPTAIVFFQEDAIRQRFRCIHAFENDGSEDADFIASVLVGIPISGSGYDYRKYPGLLDLMDWIANLRKPIVYYGDPYGTHRGADGKRSYYEALAETSATLTQKKGTIFVRTLTANDARSYESRKIALNKVTPKLDFHNGPGPQAVLLALQRSSYPEQRATSQRTRERLEPKHDEFSHLRSCAEFFAVNIESQAPVSTFVKPKLVRRTIGGKRR